MIPPHPLTNFEIQAYYQNERRFKAVFSRDNLSNIIKNGAYVINLDEYLDIGTHWVALYVNNKAQIFLEYRHMIQKFVVIFVLDLSTLCSVVAA